MFLLHLGFDCMGLIQLLKEKRGRCTGQENMKKKKSSLLFEWLLYSDN